MAFIPTPKVCICCDTVMTHWSYIVASCCDGCWCAECLEAAFRQALVSENAWPVRCCEPLDYDDVKGLLSSELVAALDVKIPLYETPGALRAYCCNRDCAVWIIPTNISNGIATCLDCSQQTCIRCKNAAHQGECVVDEDTQQTLAFATANSFKQCPTCCQLIEKTEGCLEMTCTCGMSFCYNCGGDFGLCIGVKCQSS